MIDTSGFKANRSYFAAANGYKGFRSLFGEIFNSEGLDRLFILKGGPGTGKSTILKGAIAYAARRGYGTEAIYCSSDPKSLDGAIVSHGSKRIAVIDGTAPHERDAIFPGAVDEIINLADSFDNAALSADRYAIIALAKEKSAAYKSAYARLAAAGKVAECIRDNYTNNEIYSKAEMKAGKLAQDVASACNRGFKRAISSAFGASGYTKLKLDQREKKREITVSNDSFEAQIIMRSLLEKLHSKGAVCELHISPFAADEYEAIVTDEAVFTAPLFPLSTTSLSNESLSEDITTLLRIHGEFMKLAENMLKKASEKHFALEEIYTKAVNFKSNERLFERIIGSIDSILGG